MGTGAITFIKLESEIKVDVVKMGYKKLLKSYSTTGKDCKEIIRVFVLMFLVALG